MAGRKSKIQNLVWRTAFFLGLLFGVGDFVLSESVDARLSDGTAARGTLEGNAAGKLRFLTKGEECSLNEIRQIEFPRSSPVLQASLPVRVVYLRGGEQITAQWLRFTEEEITLLWRGKTITFPRQAVLAIDQLPSERQLLYDDFNARELASNWKTTGRVALGRFENCTGLSISAEASISHSLKEPLNTGRLSVAYIDYSPESKSRRVGLELNFGDDKSEHRLTIDLASANGVYDINHSSGLRLTRQRLRRSSGRHHVAVLFDKARFQVLIDSHVLASGRPLNVPLTSIRLYSEPVETDSGNPPGEFLFQSAGLVQFLPDREPEKLFSQDKQAQVQAENAEIVYGNIIALDAKEVRIQAAFGEARMPWSQVHRVIFAEDQRAEPLASDQKSSSVGWQSDVTFQHFADHPYHSGDRLSVALLAADADSLTLAHPLLGTHEIPRAHLDRLDPKFYGRSLILSGDQTHLGNQVKASFLHKKPEGSERHGEFRLETIPPGAAFIRLTTAELEPAGKDTLPGSRHLAELRNGGLGTQVILNGTSLGRLNDLISQKADRETPQVLRLRVPADLLRSGKNTWAIRQTPMRNHPKELDDCELGPIVLEVEQSPGD